MAETLIFAIRNPKKVAKPSGVIFILVGDMTIWSIVSKSCRNTARVTVDTGINSIQTTQIVYFVHTTSQTVKQVIPEFLHVPLPS
jgi:hypothetical protein